MTGRRLPVIEGKSDIQALTWPEQPGDYCGPVSLDDGRMAVFFLKPNARDLDAPPTARGVHFVASPPHRFRECTDGSLEIRDSIGDRRSNVPNDISDGWHGYLDEGHIWRKV